MPLNYNAKNCACCLKPKHVAGGKWVRGKPASIFVCAACSVTSAGEAVLKAARQGRIQAPRGETARVDPTPA